jgi:AsmA family
MKPRFRPQARYAVIALLALVAVGWYAPRFFSAERYRQGVQLGLERALGRSARFGAISFHLLPRPGFTLENVVIGEDAAFGAEPFARVDRMDCDFRLRSLIPWRLDILRLSLERPSFNLVRNGAGKWNIESLIGPGAPSASRTRPAGPGPAGIHLEVSDGRINFKLRNEKEPFVLNDVDARLDLDPARGGAKFHLTASPVRTDLLLPTPGELEFEGEWTPAGGPAGSLDATLTTQGSMLYDWIPILTGKNPNIYGVLNSTAHLTGSLLNLSVEGRLRVAQLHRWDQPPPSGGMDSAVYFRARYDRTQSRLSIESVDASFADSHVHATGSVEDLHSVPMLDFVVAVERSHLEDFRALASRFDTHLGDWSASGRVDALMTIQGPWTERRYGGFLQIRNVRLTTPTGTYPVSEVSVRLDRGVVRLAPTTVTLSPRMELVADGQIKRETLKGHGRPQRALPTVEGPYRYALNLSAKSVPLRDMLRFARGMGVRAAETLDARGDASAGFLLTGRAWPPGPPEITGQVDLHGARLLIPGLTEPLNLPKAHIEFRNGAITANPLVAVLGTSVFSGRLEHAVGSKQPWNFNIRANALRLEQGALWFDVLGIRPPLPLIARIPGLRSLVERRTAASHLLTALNARGRFRTPKLIYRDLTLHDFQSSIEISDRVIRLQSVAFHAGGGRGTGKLVVDLTQSPPRVTADASLEDARLQALAPVLPAPIEKTRGFYSARGHFITLGLSRGEIISHLEGQGEVLLGNVNFGSFDPVAAMARASRQGDLGPPREEDSFRSAVVNFRVNGGRVTVSSGPVAFAGAHVKLQGTYILGGIADMNIVTDLHGLSRRPATEGEPFVENQQLRLHLAGPLNKLTLEPSHELSKAVP